MTLNHLRKTIISISGGNRESTSSSDLLQICRSRTTILTFPISTTTPQVKREKLTLFLTGVVILLIMQIRFSSKPMPKRLPRWESAMGKIHSLHTSNLAHSDIGVNGIFIPMSRPCRRFLSADNIFFHMFLLFLMQN